MDVCVALKYQRRTVINGLAHWRCIALDETSVAPANHRINYAPSLEGAGAHSFYMPVGKSESSRVEVG